MAVRSTIVTGFEVCHPDNRAANEEEYNEEEDNEEEDNAEEALDEEIWILQKKKKIADLRRELASNEFLYARPPDFQDVKCLVPLFAGSDSYVPQKIVNKLKKTTYINSKTSVMGYILKMQEIASRADIDEAQTVQMIVDGFRDRSADISVLYPAKHMMQLKQLARRYTQLREIRSSSVRDTLSVPARNKSKAKGGSDSELRCYNCSGKGHVSARCPEPRREPGSCFRCGSREHIIKNCPKPSPRNKDEAIRSTQ
ncbi:uncharacterized protein LOC135701230 [Ochlerotatus camptorhynchus]|uniref:uncharacterized protein LOC135701230 n=1 Tax=Ochlerotatus camptorhynchus TaxID=644619 RepID=UPI0031E16597